MTRKPRRESCWKINKSNVGYLLKFVNVTVRILNKKVARLSSTRSFMHLPSETVEAFNYKRKKYRCFVYQCKKYLF